MLHKSAVTIDGRSSAFWGNTLLPVFIQSVAVFTYFKYKEFKSNSLIVLVSKYTFGIYLIHPFVLEILNRYEFNTLTFNALASVPVVSIVAFVISFGLIALLSKTPVKKFVM